MPAELTSASREIGMILSIVDSNHRITYSRDMDQQKVILIDRLIKTSI